MVAGLGIDRVTLGLGLGVGRVTLGLGLGIGRVTLGLGVGRVTLGLGLGRMALLMLATACHRCQGNCMPSVSVRAAHHQSQLRVKARVRVTLTIRVRVRVRVRHRIRVRIRARVRWMHPLSHHQVGWRDGAVDHALGMDVLAQPTWSLSSLCMDTLQQDLCLVHATTSCLRCMPALHCPRDTGALCLQDLEAQEGDLAQRLQRELSLHGADHTLCNICACLRGAIDTLCWVPCGPLSWLGSPAWQ